jgi:hypothetical protein
VHGLVSSIIHSYAAESQEDVGLGRVKAAAGRRLEWTVSGQYDSGTIGIPPRLAF